jgi:DeoR/GlpR family transcriptional regulator of sugar metabolism
MGDLKDMSAIITDKKPSDEWMEYFEKNGITCLYAEE